MRRFAAIVFFLLLATVFHSEETRASGLSILKQAIQEEVFQQASKSLRREGLAKDIIERVTPKDILMESGCEVCTTKADLDFCLDSYSKRNKKEAREILKSIYRVVDYTLEIILRN